MKSLERVGGQAAPALPAYGLAAAPAGLRGAGRSALLAGYLLAGGILACGPQAGDEAPSKAPPPPARPLAAAEASVDLSRGLALTRQGQLAEGLKALRRALREQPGDPMILFALARVLHLATRLGEAETFYREALDHQPGLAEAWLRLSEIQLEQGRLQEALHSVERLEQVHGHGARIDYQKGFILSKMGRFNEADRALRRSLARQGRNADAWYILGLNAQRQGRDQEAVKAFRQALQVDDSYLDAWFNLGNSLSRLGREDDAREALERFQQVNMRREREKSSQATLRVLRTGAEMALEQNRLEDAERQLQEAEAKSKNRAWIERLRGELLLARHQHEAALGRLRRAAALNPEEMTERLALAAAFRRAGQNEDAERQEEAARRILSSAQGGGS
ncbi:MAG: tetratricopeptide repeat protein [Acidobacteriota bacterium]